MNAEPLEARMQQLEHQVAQMAAQLLRLSPPVKDWRLTVGKFQDSPISREADKLGEEYRRSQRES